MNHLLSSVFCKNMQDEADSGYVLHAVIVFGKLAVGVSTESVDGTNVFLPPHTLTAKDGGE